MTLRNNFIVQNVRQELGTRPSNDLFLLSTLLTHEFQFQRVMIPTINPNSSII